MSILLHLVVPDAPQNLVADNAYDSDCLDAELRGYGIEPAALENREAFCLAAELPTSGRTIWVGIKLIGNIGMTSHIADVLRRDKVPSRIVPRLS